MNDGNLIRFSDVDLESVSKARECGKKGGILSGRKRRARKAIRELVNEIFAMPLEAGKGKKPVKLDSVKSLEELAESNMTVAVAGIVALARKVIEGDINAIKLWFEISGENKAEVKLSGAIDVKQKFNYDSLTDDELCLLAELVAKATPHAQ